MFSVFYILTLPVYVVKRKLIRFGKSAICITLPIEWIRKNNLEKGDVIDLQETLHNSLEVIPSSETSRDVARTIDLDLSGMSDAQVRYLLRAAYINGYFVIHLHKANAGIISLVREYVDDFIAAEVMEVSDESVEIHIFWDIKNINLDNILQRIRLLLKNLLSDTVSLLDSGNVEAKQISESFSLLMRQVLLARRAITYALLNAGTAKQFGYSSLELHYLSFMTEFLGNLGESLVGFVEVLEGLDGLSVDQLNEFASLMRSVEHYLRRLFEAQTAKKKTPFVSEAFVDFEQTILEYRLTDDSAWGVPVLSEYIRLMVASIRQAEFVMLKMEHAPK